MMKPSIKSLVDQDHDGKAYSNYDVGCCGERTRSGEARLEEIIHYNLDYKSTFQMDSGSKLGRAMESFLDSTPF